MALIMGTPRQGDVPAGVVPGRMPANDPDAMQMSAQGMGMPMQKPAAPVKRQTDEVVLKEMAQNISSLTRRFRILEERYINMRKRVQLMDQTILSNNKRVMNEIRTSEQELLEMRRKIEDISEKFLLMAKELEMCVKKSEVEGVRRYITLWNPVNFITQQEAEKLVRKIIEAEKAGEPFDRYPVYRPEQEAPEEPVSDLKESEEESIKQEDIPENKTIEAKEKKDKEKFAEKPGPAQRNQKEKKGKGNAADLDDITNIMHRHSPF